MTKINKIKLGVIIPVFNNIEYTKTCIQKLNICLQHSNLGDNTVSIVVVDDGSTDGTHQWLQENHPDVIVLSGNGNLWWSGGINVGVKHAISNDKCNYILWWNNDIEPELDYFSVLFKRLSNTTDKDILGSKIYVKGTKIVWSMGGVFNPINGDKYMEGMGMVDSEKYNIEFSSDWFPGMGTIMPASLYEDIGFLDNLNFPQYHGDSDFTYRAKLEGYNLITNPDLVLYNDISNTGVKHQGSFKFLYQTLFGVKSNYNIKKEIKFYRTYAKSARAYKSVMKRYYKYIGGFFKWKILGMLGVSKK